MALWDSVLFTEIRGKVGDIEGRIMPFRRKVLAEKVRPSNPRTFKQTLHRKIYGKCVEQYNKLSEEEKKIYAEIGQADNLPAYQVYMRECLNENKAVHVYEVEIDNTANPEELKDFQVLISIVGDSQFFQDCNNNKAAIRFINEDLTAYIPHWIEEWDTVNYNARIWVKVPSIIANSKTKIYMLINPNRTTDESDPYAVFDFYDGFETWEGWIQYGSGIVEQSSEVVYKGNYSLKKRSYPDPNGGYKPLGFILDYPFILEAYINRTYLSGSNADRIGVIDDSGNGYGFIMEHTNDQIGYDVRSGYRPTYYSLTSISPDPVNTWYLAQFVWNNGQIKVRILWGSYEYEGVATHTAYSSFTRVYVFGGYTYYVDEMRIRKYTDPEPTTSYKRLW